MVRGRRKRQASAQRHTFICFRTPWVRWVSCIFRNYLLHKESITWQKGSEMRWNMTQVRHAVFSACLARAILKVRFCVVFVLRFFVVINFPKTIFIICEGGYLKFCNPTKIVLRRRYGLIWCRCYPSLRISRWIEFYRYKRVYIFPMRRSFFDEKFKILSL